MYAISIEQFNGPYDLLLTLIEDNDLEISSISLADITEQFLAYIESRSIIEPEELADFLIVATKLLFLKSKLLLPVIEKDEDDNELADHLKMYKVFLEATHKVEAFYNSSYKLYSRRHSVTNTIPRFTPPPQSVSGVALSLLMYSMLRKLDPIVKLPRMMIEKTVSLKERVEQLRILLKKKERMHFLSLIQKSSSKSDVVVSFLAVLDLVNTKYAECEQDGNFTPIYVKQL